MIILNIVIGTILFISLMFNFYLIKKLNKKEKEMNDFIDRRRW
jgi:preprotein translocase subunit YajC